MTIPVEQSIEIFISLAAASWFVVAMLAALLRPRLSRAVGEIKRKSVERQLVAAAACLITVHVCATKPQTNDTDGVDAPTYGLMSAYMSPEIGGLTDDGDVYSVSNVYFSSFGRTGDVVSAGITIGADSVGWVNVLRIYATDDLAHPVWTNVFERRMRGESSLAVQFDMSQFPTSFLHRALFGLDYPSDSDGDGVEDGQERYVHHSDPHKYDTDNDGVGDGDELRIGSNLLSEDSDGDGLSDAEETGGAVVMSGSSMLWLDTSSCAELPLHYGGWSDDWDVSIPGGVRLAGSTYTSCNVNMACRLSFGDGEVAVDACGRMVYSDSSWASKVLYGTVIEGGVEYFVAECRNISTDAAGAAKMSCQIVVPKSEPNVMYVSYQRVDEGIKRPRYEFGVICSNKASPFDAQSEYTILPPVGYRMPVANTTIKYIIGLGSDPTVYNRYEEPALPPTSNSNAYYTVDIVAEDHAHIVFTGVGPSDLPDPDFWALPGDTNRVRLLIGKAYEAESDSPISIVGVSNPDAVISNVTDTSFYICRPVTFSFVPYSPQLLMSVGGTSSGTSIHVEPDNLNGVYSFERNVCCMRRLHNGAPLFCCNGQCGCGGCNSGAIWYGYEGHYLEFGQFSCGCMYRPEYDDQPEMPSQGGIVAAFADDAIIFEDRYETAPDVFVERRSTSTRLNVCVNGGMNGGMYSVSVANSSKLVFKSGEQLPVQRYVEPGQCLRFYSEYEGCAASSSVNDITVSAMFVDDVTGFTITSSDSITILKVEFRADQQALENICPHRHRLAIGESVVCSWQPSGEQVNFNVELKNGLYVCPLVETNNMLTVMYAGVTYEPNLEVIEPSSVVGVNARCGHYGISAGRPGWVALRQYFKLLPLDVNFYGIAIQEVPSFIGFHSGYFADDTFSDDWYHLERQGAGNWIRMSMTNVAEYVDTASSRREFLRVRPDGSLTSDENYPWSDGVIYWGIPIGWNYRTCASNDPPVAVMRDLVEQEFVIEQDGDFAIRKLGNEALRTIDGRLYLNGMEVYVR